MKNQFGYFVEILLKENTASVLRESQKQYTTVEWTIHRQESIRTRAMANGVSHGTQNLGKLPNPKTRMVMMRMR
jgi:hypothetical protein